MHNKTHRALLRYKISDFFRSLLRLRRQPLPSLRPKRAACDERPPDRCLRFANSLVCVSCVYGLLRLLKRLPEPLLQLHPISAADARARSILQNHFKLAMGQRFEMQDAFDVDYRGAMDSNKAHGV